MSMEINGSRGSRRSDYAEQLRDRQAEIRAEQEKIREREMGQDLEDPSEKTPVLKDEYISSEKSGQKPSGLYRLEQDEKGNPRVRFEDPKKSGDASGKDVPEIRSEGGQQPEEKYVGSTDQVDREIEKLKEKKKQLLQQIQAAFGEEKKVEALKREMAKVESELSRKDNDTYRKQNMSMRKIS